MAKCSIYDFTIVETIQIKMERRVASGVEPLMGCKLIINGKIRIILHIRSLNFEFGLFRYSSF